MVQLENGYPDFDKTIWPGLVERFPVFEALKVTGAWAGHCDHNGFDTSAILGPWVGGLETFHIALGFSSHALMQAPAAGRGLSELRFHGRYQTLDLSRLGYRRVVDSTPLHDEVPGGRCRQIIQRRRGPTPCCEGRLARVPVETGGPCPVRS